MQSLSWQIEAGIALAALQDEPAASRTQQGLPRSPRPGQAPVTRPAPPLLPLPTFWPKHRLLPKPSLSPIPEMPDLIVPGVLADLGVNSRTTLIGCVALGKSFDFSELQFPHH